jgi:PST family polysaccharide transporter
LVPGFGAEVRATLANALWKTVALSLEKASRLALVIVAAPVLGRAAFGRFQFATTVTTMLALGTDLGLGIWTTRALARSPARAAAIVATALRVRMLAALPYAALTVAVALTLGPGDTRAAILLLGIAALADAFVDHFGAILRGCERFSDEARLSAARALLVAGTGLASVSLGRSLVALAAGVAAGACASGVYGLWIIGRPRRQLARGRGTFEPALARAAVGEALPLWLAGMLSLLYFKGDTVLLRFLAGDAELGAYAAAYKVFEGSTLFPAVLLAAAFPRLARAQGDHDRQRRWERLLACVLVGVGLLVGVTLHAGGDRIVTALFGDEFRRAGPSLRALAFAVPLLYLNAGLTHFLIARDLGRKNLVFAASMLVVNVGLNLLLIPGLAGPGAAWATVLTEVALTGCCLVALASRSTPEAASRGRKVG